MRTTATRQSYGEELVQLGKEDAKIVVMDADLASATMTKLFRDTYPERFIDCGIAEANMITAAAGMSTTGWIPFVSTFAMFAAGRGFEQIRNSVAYPHLNVKVCATHAGISVGPDGASHQAIEDLSLMRSVPGMVVLNPADDQETRACLRAAHTYEGPVYVRLSRHPVKGIYERADFTIGKGHIVKDGEDGVIIATGIEVAQALEAADLLKEKGKHVAVVDMASIKPIDAGLIQECAEKYGRIVTVEDHNVIGGLGSAVTEVVADCHPVPVLRLGVGDVFGQSGNGEQLLRAYGLDAASIAERTLSFLEESDTKEA